MNSRGRAPISIYIHIPFCKSRCGYCNFYSTTRLAEAEGYVAALCRAIETAPLENREAVTVYFGGGTPSLLGCGLVTVLDALRRRVPLREDAEITVEANPGTADGATLAALRQGGFNRISFGWQAAADTELAELGRTHTADEGVAAVRAARAAGFTNLSVDIMLATPGQNAEGVRRLCQAAVSLELPHISAYLLKIEPDTPFGRDNTQQRCPDPDTAADLYLAACTALRAAGYRHYEISNFALEGFRGRHNTAYWKLDDYLGIGPAAYSYLDGRRFHFPPNLDSFVESRDIWGCTEQDGAGGDLEEYLMLALRLDEGLSLETLHRLYGIDSGRLQKRAAPLAAQGLLEQDGGRIALTDSGFLVSNSVINYLLEDIC